MTVVNYADLYKEAIEAAGGIRELLADGNYHVKISAIKPGTTTKGKFSVGFKLDVLDGPAAGKTTWVNLYLTEDKPVPLGIYIRTMIGMGVPHEVLATGPAPDTLHNYVLLGTTGTARLSSFGDPPRQDLKGFNMDRAGVGTSVPAPAAPAAPVPVPVPVAVPVPVQAPVAAPVAPAEDVEALKARLAALEAPAASVPAADAPKTPF